MKNLRWIPIALFFTLRFLVCSPAAHADFEKTSSTYFSEKVGNRSAEEFEKTLLERFADRFGTLVCTKAILKDTDHTVYTYLDSNSSCPLNGNATQDPEYCRKVWVVKNALGETIKIGTSFVYLWDDQNPNHIEAEQFFFDGELRNQATIENW